MWFAIIRPLTLWAEGRYGDFLDKATWMLAGPQGMKLASLRSLILWRLLCTYSQVIQGEFKYSTNMLKACGIHEDVTPVCTCVGSTSPWMMLRIAM